MSVGFVLSTTLTWALAPWFGFQLSYGKSAWWTCFFVALTLVRSYAIRRGFDRLERWLGM